MEKKPIRKFTPSQSVRNIAVALAEAKHDLAQALEERKKKSERRQTK